VSTTVPCPPDDGADQPAPGPGPDVWPEDVVRTPAGQPAVVLVRTARGWTPLTPGAPPGMSEGQGPIQVPRGAHVCTLPLVEAMALADLVAEEAGAAPEPDRQARLAARGSAADAPADADPRDAELARLRRTVGQLEHALAARVSIERAIGVLAERHGTDPRESFEELRRRARASGRPAQELARDVLAGLEARAAVPGPRTTADAPAEHRSPTDPVPEQRRSASQPGRPAGSPTAGAGSADPEAGPRSSTARRVRRNHPEQPGAPADGAGAHS
jgi:ANTAR domain